MASTPTPTRTYKVYDLSSAIQIVDNLECALEKSGLPSRVHQSKPYLTLETCAAVIVAWFRPLTKLKSLGTPKSDLQTAYDNALDFLAALQVHQYKVNPATADFASVRALLLGNNTRAKEDARKETVFALYVLNGGGPHDDWSHREDIFAASNPTSRGTRIGMFL
jgi:hypothetical protein